MPSLRVYREQASRRQEFRIWLRLCRAVNYGAKDFQIRPLLEELEGLGEMDGDRYYLEISKKKVKRMREAL